ncbi:hypothetical protein CC1G_13510 [Coprinopsis cinerea okayama7|uniref:Uncharacterized protein n=1 Tax=Coprinopsis cinerea (strain Okayama-7 / 130 / ATCC MYA-4618 / FGSC 9003) TaxID=240176 RepID=A8PJ33_COPC7|nr:hypothetical protein CC1G_13510 [Coprinopsis cinerea okayama7\|eukprot:XP_001841659.2 hypothetical protein CC1G_13510 [Coprinopsis cinerea okayama7\
MNRHYDQDSASIALQEQALACGQDQLPGFHLGVRNVNDILETIHTQWIAADNTWRLLQHNQKTSGTELEAVWHLHGILVKRDLPPFTPSHVVNLKNKARFLQQGVAISGFGTAIFDKVATAIGNISAHFSRYVGVNDLLPSDIVGRGLGGTVIHASNQYLTPRSSDLNGETLDPGKDVESDRNSWFLHA